MASAFLTSTARPPLAQPAAAAAARPRRHTLRVAAGQGFGAAPQKTAGSAGSKKKQPKLARYLDEGPATAAGAADGSPGDGWVEMPGIDPDTTFLSKPIKALILATGRAVCLYKVNDRIYASDANSTAYKYPLADASILSVKGKPAVESPLDGTVYELATGKVLSWCPKNTLMRKVLGGLKDKSSPEDLPVYPVEVKGGKVFVKFV